MLGVILYIVLFNLFLNFGYMLQETPNAVVNAYVDEAEYKSTVAALKLSPPSYCDNSATDYTFSATWTYNNNTCDFDLDVGDVLTKGESAVFITTYFQDTPTNPTTAAAAGKGSSRSVYSYDHIHTAVLYCIFKVFKQRLNSLHSIVCFITVTTVKTRIYVSFNRLIRLKLTSTVRT